MGHYEKLKVEKEEGGGKVTQMDNSTDLQKEGSKRTEKQAGGQKFILENGPNRESPAIVFVRGPG